MFHKKHCLNFNAITNLKSIRVGECTHQLSRGSPLYKPKTKNVQYKAIIELLKVNPEEDYVEILIKDKALLIKKINK